jgi:predicted phage terminase large subunit-like protein
VFREKTWQWWLTTALTRVEPNGGVLLIMTRWHEDDLAGRLMKQDAEGDTDEPEEKWHILNLPAIAEEGDALGRKTGAPLWEERWPLRKLAAEMDGRGCKVRIEQEGAASGKIVKYEYERMLDGYDARFTPIPKSSKFVRSGGFNAACERGQVFLIEGDWVDEWIDELTTFPRGKHDDRVDSAVGAYEALSGGGEPWEADDLEAVTRNKYEQ